MKGPPGSAGPGRWPEANPGPRFPNGGKSIGGPVIPGPSLGKRACGFIPASPPVGGPPQEFMTTKAVQRLAGGTKLTWLFEVKVKSNAMSGRDVFGSLQTKVTKQQEGPLARREGSVTSYPDSFPSSAWLAWTSWPELRKSAKPIFQQF